LKKQPTDAPFFKLDIKEVVLLKEYMPTPRDKIDKIFCSKLTRDLETLLNRLEAVGGRNPKETAGLKAEIMQATIHLNNCLLKLLMTYPPIMEGPE